jgi:hypothetical protein
MHSDHDVECVCEFLLLFRSCVLAAYSYSLLANSSNGDTAADALLENFVAVLRGPAPAAAAQRSSVSHAAAYSWQTNVLLLYYTSCSATTQFAAQVT